MTFSTGNLTGTIIISTTVCGFLHYFKTLWSCVHISAMNTIHQNNTPLYQLTLLVYQSPILNSSPYRRGKYLFTGFNIFPATVYYIPFLIATGLIHGFSQTCSKSRETQKNYCSWGFSGLSLPRSCRCRNIMQHYLRC